VSSRMQGDILGVHFSFIHACGVLSCLAFHVCNTKAVQVVINTFMIVLCDH